MAPAAGVVPLAERTRRKIVRRIVPFVFVLYIISYLDRANVAFAKLNMTADLHFSEAVFGFGAGIFFIGYLVLEIPGALLVERWSARKWISRILISWGLCTVWIGFVKTPGQFYLARFLLGLAEAGFFPGIIVYLTHWFIARDRARAMAGFIVAIPVSLALGAPASALLLKANWFGLAGWRWIFILQGLPAILFGGITLFYLTDHPWQAKWLEPEERDWISEALAEEKRRKKAAGHIGMWQALKHRDVLLLAVALSCANIGSYAYNFWLPTTMRRASGFSIPVATALASLPYVAGFVAVLWSGRASDRSRERRLHAALPLLAAAVCFTLSALPGQPFALVLPWLCLTSVGTSMFSPPFWVLPTLALGESAAAASIGLINAIGNLGGFIGPSVVGYLLSSNYSYTTAMVFLACGHLTGGLLLLAVKIRREH
jgi:ACS family tartrate transporter-like MFS transporter